MESQNSDVHERVMCFHHGRCCRTRGGGCLSDDNKVPGNQLELASCGVRGTMRFINHAVIPTPHHHYFPFPLHSGSRYKHTTLHHLACLKWICKYSFDLSSTCRLP